MAKYVLVTVSDGSGSGVVVKTTDVAVFNWILSNIKKYEPNATLTVLTSDVTGYVNGGVIERAKNFRHGSDMVLFVETLLCENGFEPFAKGMFRRKEA